MAMTKEEKEAKAAEKAAKEAEAKKAEAEQSDENSDANKTAEQIIAEAEAKAAEIEKEAEEKAANKVKEVLEKAKQDKQEAKAILAEAKQLEEKGTLTSIVPDDIENVKMIKVKNTSATTYNLPRFKKVGKELVEIWPSQITIDGKTTDEDVVVEIPEPVFKEMINRDINKARILTKKQVEQRGKLLKERQVVEQRINAAANHQKQKIFKETRPSPKELFLIRNAIPFEV